VPTVVLRLPKSVVKVARPDVTVLLKLPKFVLVAFKSAWLALVPTVVLKFPKSVS
jgi:hypothetical protein